MFNGIVIGIEVIDDVVRKMKCQLPHFDYVLIINSNTYMKLLYAGKLNFDYYVHDDFGIKDDTVMVIEEEYIDLLKEFKESELALSPQILEPIKPRNRAERRALEKKNRRKSC